MSSLREAVKEYKDRVASWRPQTSVWALAHGAAISTVCVAGSSYTILIRMRQFFNLYSQQLLLGTILPVVVLPSMGFFMSHDLFVSRKLINGITPREQKSFCSTCLEIRGSFIQMTASVIAPLVLSVFSCAAASISYRTFPMPELNNYSRVFGVFRKACSNFSSTLLLLTFANIVIGGFITERMLEQHTLINAAQVAENASN